MNHQIPDDVLETAMRASDAAVRDCNALLSSGKRLNSTALLDHFIATIMAERERGALTRLQIAELRYAATHQPIWVGVPPHKAEGDVRYYANAGLIAWTPEGYRVTELGRGAISPHKD